jgi:uncharacterized protein (DUF1800 family)
MNTRKYLIFFTACIWLISANIAQAKPVDSKILHVLNRLSYGIKAGDIDRVQSMGIDKYIQEQLNPDSIAESPALAERLAKLDTINLSPIELFQQYNPNPSTNGQNPELESRKVQQKQVRQVINQAREAKLWRSIYSQRQLQEVMVDFWYNHFNVYAEKGLDRLWVGAYEQQAIRPYALGKFRDLVGATAKHPAMLFYLDNWQNVAPVTNKKGKSKGLNENYARELMELHTLGVDDGYKQDDVISLAKILTGWGFKQPGKIVPDGYSFHFNPTRHDLSNKIFLGQNIIGSDISEGEQALDILSRHPSTARHISFKLAQYFVADNPPKSLVDRLSKSFIATEGDIKLVLDTLFHSPEFMDKKYYGSKFKTPYQYAVSSVRSLESGAENNGNYKPNLSRYGFINNPKPLNDFLNQLGMSIYGCPTPNGYKNTQNDWLNPDSMTRRLNFATNLGSDKLPILLPPIQSAETINKAIATVTTITIESDSLMATLGNNFSLKTQQAIAASPPEIRAALILGSPEFMYK